MKEPFRVDVDCPHCENAMSFMVRAPENLEDIKPKPYIPQAVGIYANNNYDPKACIGTVAFVDGGLEVTLFDGLTMNNDEITDAFGSHIGVDPVLMVKEKYSKFIIRSYMIKKIAKKDYRSKS
jgi:hypothetical protein